MDDFEWENSTGRLNHGDWLMIDEWLMDCLIDVYFSTFLVVIVVQCFSG